MVLILRFFCCIDFAVGTAASVAVVALNGVGNDDVVVDVM